MMNQEQATKAKQAIAAAIFAVYKNYDSMGLSKVWTAGQVLLFINKCFDNRITFRRNPIAVYSRYYNYLSGHYCNGLPIAIKLDDNYFSGAFERIRKEAERQCGKQSGNVGSRAAMWEAERRTMLDSIKSYIYSLQAMKKPLEEARKLQENHLDTIGAGAQSVLKAYLTMKEHNIIKSSDYSGSLVLWAFFQGVKSERAKRKTRKS